MITLQRCCFINITLFILFVNRKEDTMTKRILLILLAFLMAFALLGCAEKQTEPETKTNYGHDGQTDRAS